MERKHFLLTHKVNGNRSFFTTALSPSSGLQGHAIKNQDLLIASGTISSRGSEGLTAVDEDVEAAVSNDQRPSLLYR